MRVSGTSVCLFVLLVALMLGSGSWSTAHASLGGTAVATSFTVIGGAVHGDIISYDPQSETYTRSTRLGDEQMFGVVVDNPILFVDSYDTATTHVPIVRDGEAEVAVSTLGGPIEVGDYITTSRIEGVGQRVNANKRMYVLGVALEPFANDSPGAEFVAVGNEQVALGQIPVALRMGFYVPEFEENALKGALGATAEDNETGVDLGAFGEDRSFMILRYVLAAVVTFAAIVIALRSFGGSLSDSIVSVGRNPMARSYILSMMIWNSMLILVVSGVGLALGAAIILYP